MSYSSTFRVHGLDKHNLSAEWIGDAHIMSISIEEQDGRRKENLRIDLSEYSYHDLCMFASYISAFINAMDPQDMYVGENFEDGDEPIG